MRTPTLILINLILLIAFSFLMSCGKTTAPDDEHSFPDPIDSVAQNITLKIHSIYNDSLLESETLETEGTTTIDVADTGLVISLGFNVYALADGFYSKVFNRHNGDTLTVDLDAVPNEPNSITGVVFETPSMAHHCYYANRSVAVYNNEGFSCSTSTDTEGRYGIGDMPLGQFILKLDSEDSSGVHEIENTAGTDYEDLDINRTIYIDAPYIYLYPEEQTDISVNLRFLQGGNVTESEPPYNNGWDVNVTPEGIINGQYNYLFYEGTMPHLPIPESGWLIGGDNLQGDISALLSNLGFNENETEDFIDYWIPVIQGHPYYGFFYLDPNSIIELSVYPVPDNTLRMFFYIEPLDRPIAISSPELSNQFSREGFSAVEWGVIGWHDR